MVDRAVIVPWRPTGEPDRDAAYAWVDERWALVRPPVLRCYGDGGQPFSRSRARNNAFGQLAARMQHRGDEVIDAVLIADADTVVPQTQIDAGYQLLADEPHTWVILYGEERYYNLAQGATRRLLEQPPDVEPVEPTDPADWEHKITSWAGALLVPVDAWLTVGGYDTRFRGWGGEDNAFQFALDTLWAPHRRVDGFCIHLWHPRGDADFDQPYWPHNAGLLKQYRQANRRPDRMRRLIAR